MSRPPAAVALHRVLFGLFVALAVAGLLPASTAKLLLLATLSGIAPLLALRRRWSFAELLVAGPSASLATWSLLTALLWKVGISGFALGLVPAVIALALLLWDRRRRRVLELSAQPTDFAALAVMLLALVPVAAVFTANGPTGEGYTARGWFARDTYYLFALAQMAVERSTMPPENPFLAGIANHYPALLHVGLGGLSSQSGAPVAISMLKFLPLLLVSVPGLLVTAAVRAANVPNTAAAAVLAASAACVPALLRLDLFVYPQTQILGFGLLLLAVLLWGEGRPTNGEAVAVVVLCAVLVFGHTISAAAAILFLSSNSTVELWRKDLRRRGAVLAVTTLVLAVLFVRQSALPFAGTLRAGVPAEEVFHALSAYVVPWLPIILGVALIAALSWRRGPPALVGLGLLILGALYQLYAAFPTDPFERWFASFNAERFLIIGVLCAVPTLLAMPRRLALIALGLLLAGAVLYRPGDHLTGTLGLIREPGESLETRDLNFYERVRRETPPDARFFTGIGGYAFPAFTGRSQPPVENNIWGLNTVDPKDFEARLAEHQTLFTRTPDQRTALLQSRGYTHLLIRSGLTGETAQRWADAEFRPGTSRVVISDGRYLVFEVKRR